ncbi:MULTISPECIES: DUF6625 family protein [unclassified Pseudomonas]|uniref:DUF6625 family protein n=1 Tax=unclassified Pseudomonas TaxID=196821 RepID=UPI002AC8E1D0|nr:MULTISPECIES: DUF6625 family protein [unclassified Pseudomonas]MEB0044862.1 hypothetical protein [Pseudomonas sp. Dout3]MEB0096171.1 hypothetical protein [Pseudomonas sp. DC1.2]WPX59426.1 hypothetical protein RHM68_01890 [Pseudomonas sp. DC1.2]
MTNTCPRILFLIPFFGKWPFWMPFYLESCRRNPNIDWLLFSDCGVPENLPPNVTVEALSFSDYCALVSHRLNIDFQPTAAYKLCDIKPALGHIHADRLQGYDFWAFGDIDLVYGDLRHYFPSDRLAGFDLFSTHERRVAGHLCLMRNTARKREAFKQIKGWQQRFTDQEHHALDEGAFSRIFIWRKNFPKPLFNLLGKFNSWRRSSEFTEAFSTPGGCIKWHDGTDNFPCRWYWRDGFLSNDRDGDRQFPYFHFVCWKRNEWSRLPHPDPAEVKRIAAEPAWVIDATGFHQGEL